MLNEAEVTHQFLDVLRGGRDVMLADAAEDGGARPSFLVEVGAISAEPGVEEAVLFRVQAIKLS